MGTLDGRGGADVDFISDTLPPPPPPSMSKNTTPNTISTVPAPILSSLPDIAALDLISKSPSEKSDVIVAPTCHISDGVAESTVEKSGALFESTLKKSDGVFDFSARAAGKCDICANRSIYIHTSQFSISVNSYSSNRFK